MRIVRNSHGGSLKNKLEYRVNAMGILKIFGYFWFVVGGVMLIYAVYQTAQLNSSNVSQYFVDEITKLKLQNIASGVLWLLAGLSVFVVCDIVSFNIQNDYNCDSQIRDQRIEIAEIKQELEKLKSMKKNNEGKSQDYEIEG